MDKNPLQDHFIQTLRNDIESSVLPNLPTMFDKHYPELRISYKPKDEETFLFAYVVGNLESSYDTKYIEEFGLEAYTEHVYFAISRFVSSYKEDIMAIVQQYLKDNPS